MTGSSAANYTTYVVCPAAVAASVRQDVERALQSAGMTALDVDVADGAVDAYRCRALVEEADLTVVIAGFRLGDPAPRNDRTTLELACDAARAPLVLVPKRGTKADPTTDYDQTTHGPDFEKHERLQALKRRFEGRAIEYELETLGTTLMSALREWRRAREALPGAPPSPATDADFARDLDDYRRRATSLYGSVPLAGFGRPMNVSIRLEDLFVPLHALVAREPGDALGNALEAEARLAERSHELPLTEAFWRGDLSRKRRGLVLLGDPGSGKTTHLKRLLLWIVEKGGSSLGLAAGTVPLFLPLRALKSGEDDLRSFVLRTFGRELPSIDEGFVDGLLMHPSLLFLLDGLDEIFDEGARRDATRWIERLLDARPDARCVVTCRYAGYTKEVRLDGRFLELQLRPLTKAQAETFVRNWYRIVEGGLAKEEEQGRARGEQRAADLIELLGRADVRVARVYELTRNPLLLTAICLVHRDRGELSKKRAVLYDTCIDVILEGWRRAQGFDVPFTAADARNVLKPLALWMHQEGRVRATAAELVPHLGAAHARKTGEPPEQFLQTILDQSGLLTRGPDDQYGFMHLGFQEYLAALELRDRAAEDPDVLRWLAERFGGGWWREVVLLFLADGAWFAPFFRELAKHRVFVEEADLVRECVDEADRPSPEPFLELLRDTSASGDLGERQAVAAAVLREIAPDELVALGWAGHGPDLRSSPRGAADPRLRSLISRLGAIAKMRVSPRLDALRPVPAGLVAFILVGALVVPIVARSLAWTAPLVVLLVVAAWYVARDAEALAERPKERRTAPGEES